MLSLDPRSALAHNNLGNALRDKGDLDGAIAEYREAIRLDPRFANAHCNLGNALSDKGDLDGAIAEYREAIRLDPKHVRAHNNLGTAFSGKEGPGRGHRRVPRGDPARPEVGPRPHQPGVRPA